MLQLPPGSTRTDTLFPYTTLFRSRGAAPAGVKRMFLLRFSRPESAEVSAFARDSQRGSRVQRKLSTKLRTAIFGPGDCAAATFLTCRARRGRGCGPRWRPPAGRGRTSAADRGRWAAETQE